MSWKSFNIWAGILLLISVSGCASTGLNGLVDKAGQTWERTVTTLTPQDRTKDPIRWNWMTAIPQNATRAEVVKATLPLQTIAGLVPDFEGPEIQLVSTAAANPPVEITRIDKRKITNMADLYNIVDDVMDSQNRQIEVELTPANDSRAQLATMSPNKLLELTQSTVPEVDNLRISQGGNPWVVVRDAETGCKMMARWERHSGLLQVILSLRNATDSGRPLPVELRSFANGKPLNCLNVSEVLEHLYGDPGSVESSEQLDRTSFAQVSETADYLIPANFKRLNEQSDEETRFSIERPLPAFATLAGVQYPGPAVLGDARALTAFLLQRQIQEEASLEHTGWVIFDASQVKPDEALEIELDLGQGPQRFQFMIPQM